MAGELKHRVNILLRNGAAKYTTPQNFFDYHIHFFRPASRPPLDSKKDPWVLGCISDHIATVNLYISKVSAGKWTQHVLKDAIDKISKDVLNAKISGTGLAEVQEVRTSVNRYLRWAITGGRPGPGIPSTMEILGRKVTIQALEDALVECNSFIGQAEVFHEVVQSSSDHAVE